MTFSQFTCLRGQHVARELRVALASHKQWTAGQQSESCLLVNTSSPLLTNISARTYVCWCDSDWNILILRIHSCYYTYHQVQNVFMCFVWIWEQTAIISLYSINWLVFITETQCVYCAVRTGSLYIIVRSAHTVYLCVLCGSQNKQRLFPIQH